MNHDAFARALNAHNMLASQVSEYIWQILDSKGAVIGEIFDALKGAEVRNGATPKANRLAIRALIKSMKAL